MGRAGLCVCVCVCVLAVNSGAVTRLQQEEGKREGGSTEREKERERTEGAEGMRGMEW